MEEAYYYIIEKLYLEGCGRRKKANFEKIATQFAVRDEDMFFKKQKGLHPNYTLLLIVWVELIPGSTLRLIIKCKYLCSQLINLLTWGGMMYVPFDCIFNQ